MGDASDESDGTQEPDESGVSRRSDELWEPDESESVDEKSGTSGSAADARTGSGDASTGSEGDERRPGWLLEAFYERIGPDTEPPPDSKRREFWRFLCEFAHYFYVFLLMITVFLILNLVVLALVPTASLPGDVIAGRLVIIGLNFGFLLSTALGVGYVIWRCNQVFQGGR